MKVSELVAALNGMPQDADVMCHIYDESEGEIQNCDIGDVVEVKLIETDEEFPEQGPLVGLGISRHLDILDGEI